MMNQESIEDDRLYNYLLTNWDNSVPDFRLWLQHVCGIKPESELYIDLDYLIKSNDDINDWVNFFDGDIDAIYEATERYKEVRLNYVDQAVVSL